jgi:hypothetical protein
LEKVMQGIKSRRRSQQAGSIVMDLDVWRSGRKEKNRRRVGYVQMPEFVEIFGFFEGFFGFAVS